VIAAYITAAFVLGLVVAVPLSFVVSRGFRFVWSVPAWRFDPESLEDEMPSWATLECEREW
jgi:hypothetical protein